MSVENEVRSERVPGGCHDVPRLHDFLIRVCDSAPDRIALVHDREQLSYGELATRAAQLARALLHRGVVHGDRVMIYAGNTVATAVAFWGVLLAGAVAVPINPLTRTDKLAWLLDHSRATALITERRLLAWVAPAAARAASLRAVLVVGLSEPAALPGAVDLAAALAAEPSGALPRHGSPAELAAVIYTSGSTGRPKGVMLSHHNMISAAASITQYLGLREDDVLHGVPPLAFDYGLYQLIMSVRQGARLVLASPFVLPALTLKQAAAEGVTVFPGVPTMFAMLDDLRGALPDLSRVRTVTSTAAALTEHHVAAIRRVFPRAQIFSMYGITECKRCTYLPPADLARKPGSVGLAIPGTELWLVDDRDRRLGPDEVGQLVIRGATVMRGYWDAPGETARTLRPGPTAGERVLYTGDLCRLDADGYLYFVGRMDDIIKSRGEKVAPKEVEMALQAIPGVREAAVIGVDDAVLGQAIMAFVVVAEGAALTEATLLSACRDRLERYMIPRAIAIVPALARSPNGKIDKLALVRCAT